MNLEIITQSYYNKLFIQKYDFIAPKRPSRNQNNKRLLENKIKIPIYQQFLIQLW